jgi:hypothetical protein
MFAKGTVLSFFPLLEITLVSEYTNHAGKK